MANSIDLDEVAHFQALRCLQIQLFPSLAFNPVVLRTAKTLWTAYNELPSESKMFAL